MLQTLILMASSNVIGIIAITLLFYYSMRRSKALGLIVTPLATGVVASLGVLPLHWSRPDVEGTELCFFWAQHFVLLSILLLIFGVFQPVNATLKSRRLVAVLSAVLAILSVDIAYEPIFARIVENRRARLPVESVAERLAYEEAPRRALPTVAATPLSDHVALRLKNSYWRKDEIGRASALEEIHSEYVDEFIVASGFGLSRVPYLFPPTVPEVISLPEEELELSESEFEESFVMLDGQTIRKPETADAKPIASAELLDLHDGRLGDFLSVDKIGAALGNQRVAGFKSHFFNQPKPVLSTSRGNWKLVRLELVSLLKFEEPRAYVTHKLPQMEQLKSAPTRALSSFESTALEKLWREEDLVHEEYESHIRMLGSIRAIESCRSCHRVAVGDLLGAFSYVLTLEPTSLDQ